jgi:glucose uptake protein
LPALFFWGVTLGSFGSASRPFFADVSPANLSNVLLAMAGGVLFNYLLMRKSLDGSEPVSMEGYWKARGSWHLWGVAGGAVWCTGAVLNFVASRAHIVGPAVSYSIGQGATMISAAWGVFVWREFAGASQRSKMFLVWMFIFFLCGLTAIALAPIL